MKRLLIISVIALSLTSCASTDLYYWGGGYEVSRYEELAYKSYASQTPESICELVVLYEDMTSNVGGIRNTVPPGICAEYGFLLLQEHTLESFEKYATSSQRSIFDTDDLSTLFAEKGMNMLEKEMALYPESVKFIEPLIKRMKGN